MNYSRQRETVYNVLKSTNSHPSADWIYEQCKKELPNISLGTVYRNLELLINQGKAIKIAVAQDKDRYDADTSLHFHCECPVCGKVSDIEISDGLRAMLDKEAITKNYNSYSLTFIKCCDKCKI